MNWLESGTPGIQSPTSPKATTGSPCNSFRLEIMFRYGLAFMLTLFMLPAISAEDPDIRNLMTEEEFAASGLGRLSSDEIEVINRWLIRYTAQDAAEMRDNSPAVREVERATIRSRIDGEFNGWNGPTTFKLKNGQVWETRSSRSYSHFAIDPEVELTRNWLSIYRMRILETGQAINVRRVE